MPTTENKEAKSSSVRDLFKLGAHFGYSRSRRHPSAEPFIWGYKNRTAIIDLEKTLASLEQAKAFVQTLGSQAKTILVVGNKREAQEIVAAAAQSVGWPYVSERWLGGTLTNFEQIKKRIARLEELTTKREQGELAVYTKKERGLIDREINSLKRYFASLSALKRLPDALLAIDPAAEKIAVAEANKLKIPVVALANADCDLAKLAYPVVANDAQPAMIKYFIDEIIAAYETGKKLAVEIKPAEPTPAAIAPAA